MTDEEPELVDAWFDENRPTYPIAVLANTDFEDFIGVEFFPTAAVIDPEGLLRYSGSAGTVQGPLKEALSKATKGTVHPKALAKAMTALRRQEIEKSYAEVGKVLGDDGLEDETRAAAEALRLHLEEIATAALERARALEEEGFLLDAHERAALFSGAKSPFPTAAEGRAFMEALEASPGWKDEVKGGKLFRQARESEAAGEYMDAIGTYKKILKRHAGSRIAENARARAEEVIEAGLPGKRMACEACRRGRRACEKHAEDVELDP